MFGQGDNDARRLRRPPATSSPLRSWSDTATGDTLAPEEQAGEGPTRSTVPNRCSQRRSSPGPRQTTTSCRRRSQRILEEDASLRRRTRRRDASRPSCGAWVRPTSQITIEKLDRKFGVKVDQVPVRVAYRETISRPTEAEGKHKKQSGGHGQFGVCHLRIAPAPPSGRRLRRSSIEIKGGSIPRQFIPAVEKGLARDPGRRRQLRLPRGGPRSSTVDDGKYHSVDSSEMAFKLAARAGFKEAPSRQCRPRRARTRVSKVVHHGTHRSTRAMSWVTSQHAVVRSRDPRTTQRRDSR